MTGVAPTFRTWGRWLLSSCVAGLVAVLVVAGLGVPLPVARAVPLSFVVTQTGDAGDTLAGDGVCAAVTGGCTLRAAIQEANANAGHDTVTFPPLSLFHHGERIALTSSGPAEDLARFGDLDVTDSLTVRGNGARRTIVDAGGLTSPDRVLDVDPAGTGVSLEISDLTISGGDTTGGGAGVRVGGTLKLRRVVVEDNVAGGRGGGIVVDPFTASAELDDVVVRANRAREAAGIANGGTLTLRGSSVVGNEAASGTGGVENTGAAQIAGTTVSGNRGNGSGPGYFPGGVMTSGSATLANVTISGNTGDPGGLLTGGPTRLVNVTVASNTGGIFNHAAAGGTLSAVNTIVADSPFVPGVNCYGPIVSLGHNLEDSASCGFTAPTDLQHAPPALEPLAHSVGRTQTRALPATSPAVDAGDPAACPALDQRGVGRPQGAGCDIGAFELQVGGFVVNSPVDEVDAAPGDGRCETAVPSQCTLRAAVIETNALAGADLVRIAYPGRITLTRSGAGEDLSATGDLDVTDDLTLVGTGSATTVVRGDGSRLGDRILHVPGLSRPGVAVQVRGISFENGNPPGGDGGDVLVGDVTDPAPPRVALVDVQARRGVLGALSHGGGIATEGDVELTAGAVVANRASSGGGVSAGIAGELTLVDSVVAGNTATDTGGGIFLGAGSTGRLTRVEIRDNTAAGDGGGVWNVATLHATAVTTTANRSGRWGGGLFNDLGASAALTTSTLSANVAAAGGGAYNVGRLSVVRSTVDGNDALGFGGGGVSNTGIADLSNSTVSGNQGNLSGGGLRNTTGTFTVASSTVTGNSAAAGGGVVNGSGSLTLLSSILDNPGDNCSGSVTSQGHNLETGLTCAFGTGDLSQANPLLGPLAANGGDTRTHALLSGSQARDAGAAGAGCPATDQRGVPRPQGPGCDVGAYEAV